MNRTLLAAAGSVVFSFALCTSLRAEPRYEVSYIRGPYNFKMYSRHNDAYEISAAIHFYHGKQHDVLQLTPLAEHARIDKEFNDECLDFLKNRRAQTEPHQEYYGPYTARLAWKLFRAIDWTHQHHEQTYDILSDADIGWDRKKEWTDRAVRLYLERNGPGVARSVAPLDVTMRRAAVMMKPYFAYYRNYYPESSTFAFAAHWWHPAIYEAQMLGGNGPSQDRMVEETDETFKTVLVQRPLRMLLSREMMPRYSRMSPESANIFDNLHMLHGIAYDILAYEGWTEEQKHDELYRVIDAMSYQPGDEKWVRKFSLPYPEVDPRRYEPWMQTVEGSMSEIMMEMLQEMMPGMMPRGKEMSPEMHSELMQQFQMKMRPGLQPGEIEGSLADAMMKIMPEMKMDPAATEPGKTPTKMVDVMLQGWREKHGGQPDVPSISMEKEPVTR